MKRFKLIGVFGNITGLRKVRIQTYVLLRQRVDKLWENLVRDNGFSELIRVVGETSEGQSSRLLNGWNIIEKKWSEKGHHT